MTNKITISLSSSLLEMLDQLARKWGTTRSNAVAELLREVKRKELKSKLEEGYTTWADVNHQDAETFLPSQAEVVLNDQG